MKTRRIQVTVNHIHRLIEDLRAQPSIDKDLSDEEFLDSLTMDMMPTEDIDPIDDYPPDSPAYAAEIKRRAEVAKVWEGEEGKRRLDALSAKLLGQVRNQDLEKVAASQGKSLADRVLQIKVGWQVVFGGGLLVHEDSVTDWEWESEDHTVSGNATLDRQNGDLCFRFSSRDLKLEGAQFVIQVNQESRVGTLELLPPLGQLVAKVTIPTPYRKREDLKNALFGVQIL